MKRSIYISVLSVISSFAVIMLHTNSCFWEFSRERYWITANVIECVMYFAVPIFFMISGATLINYRERYSTKQYFEKRIKKTVIPFVTWSIIGLIYCVLRDRIILKEISFLNILEMMFNTQIIGIYWFFISLFAVYMAIPVFSAIPKEKRKSIFTYLAIFGFVFNCLLPFCATILNFSYNNSLRIGVASEYLLYIIIGYLLHEYECDKRFRLVVYIMGVFGLILHIAGTYYLSISAGNIITTFKGYNNLPCVLYSCGIFVFAKQCVGRIEKSKIVQFIISLNQYTFSVYLMHWFVMDILISVFDINIKTIGFRVGAPVIIFIFCVLIAKLVRKIPIAKYLLP